ncbi:MAG: hypothetical protein HQL39_17205 [Alphaproteobacteria bacterium]|nr:hypothetical protein [Alphaproteobacteria bacterium]
MPEHRRFEGQPFKPPAHLPWVKATLLPEGGAVVAWGKGGLVRQRGALRVDLFGPIEDGLGLARLERLADALLAWFAPGTALSEGPLLVRVLGVQREPFREEPGGLVVAVRISWFCDMTG